MKRISVIALLIVVLSLAFNEVNAQKKFATYEVALSQKPFSINITIKENDDFSLYIDALSLDKLNETGGIIVEERRYDEFIEALKQAKSKYSEWVNTAKKNNVTDLSKEMDIDARVTGYFLYGGDWKFQRKVTLTFDFRISNISDDIKYLLIARTGKMQASSNQFMEMDGVVLAFENASQIQDFIDTISITKINEFKNKPKAEDLFN